MHSGFLLIIRRFVVYAKPWQQLLACVVVVVAGVALIAVGVHVGAIMAFFGLLFGWQMLRAHRAARFHQSKGDVEDSEIA